MKSEHAQLVKAMSGFGAQIKKATDALRNPDSRTIAEAQRTIQSATQTVNVRIDAAIAAINSKLERSDRAADACRPSGSGCRQRSSSSSLLGIDHRDREARD